MNNPPAFPIEKPCLLGEEIIKREWDGMTLRDYFAAAALQGYVAHFGDKTHHSTKPKDWAESYAMAKDASGVCYDLADAMIEVREKGAI